MKLSPIVSDGKPKKICKSLWCQQRLKESRLWRRADVGLHHLTRSFPFTGLLPLIVSVQKYAVSCQVHP